MLAALRFIPDGDRRVRDGDWAVRRGRELGAATVGIVGFGRIGQGVAKRLSGFGPRILASDPFLPEDAVRTTLLTICAAAMLTGRGLGAVRQLSARDGSGFVLV